MPCSISPEGRRDAASQGGPARPDRAGAPRPAARDVAVLLRRGPAAAPPPRPRRAHGRAATRVGGGLAGDHLGSRLHRPRRLHRAGRRGLLRRAPHGGHRRRAGRARAGHAGGQGPRRLRGPPDRRRPADAGARRHPHGWTRAGRRRTVPVVHRAGRRRRDTGAGARPVGAGRAVPGRAPGRLRHRVRPLGHAALGARVAAWPCARSRGRRGSRPSPPRPACSTAR